VRNLWCVNKVQFEGHFDQRKECNSGRILKTTYFKLTNCTSISGIKPSFFSRREARHGNTYASACKPSFIFKDLCQTNLWWVNCDQAQKYSSHSTADTAAKYVTSFSFSPLGVTWRWRQLQKIIEHKRYVNKPVLRIGGMTVTGANTSTRRKTCPGATLSTGYLT